MTAPRQLGTALFAAVPTRANCEKISVTMMRCYSDRDNIEGMDAMQKEAMMSVVWRLMMYPVIMFFGFIFGSINRIQNAASPAAPSVVLYCLATFFLNVNGFLNAIVYGLNAQIQKDIRKCCGLDDEEDDASSGAGIPAVALEDSDVRVEMNDVDLSSPKDGGVDRGMEAASALQNEPAAPDKAL